VRRWARRKKTGRGGRGEGPWGCKGEEGGGGGGGGGKERGGGGGGGGGGKGEKRGGGRRGGGDGRSKAREMPPAQEMGAEEIDVIMKAIEEAS